MVSLILLLGLSCILITSVILSHELERELKRKGISSAKGLAATSLMDILSQNSTRLKQLAENEKKSDRDTVYVFILDSSGRTLAHTFKNGFPINLLKVNPVTGPSVNVQLLDTQLGLIYDVAAPVLLDKGLLGQVHLGVSARNIQQAITGINLILIVTTLFIVAVAIFLAYKISYLVTKPISQLLKAAQNIQEGDFSIQIEARAKDEIGILSGAFNKMASRLDQILEEKERLTKYQERERITFDLHDSCAQDLANLIKRLELCEKFFRIAPARAFEEINALKESVRSHLNRTRQVMAEFKAGDDAAFELWQRLKEYVDDFQNQGGINIKLETPQSLVQVVKADKARQIFYIITEALTNIKKHAQAKNVELKLTQDNLGLSVSIKDDGRGFDVQEAELSALPAKKWGLTSMRQRTRSLGVDFSINSLSGQGTVISFTVPFGEIEYTI